MSTLRDIFAVIGVWFTLSVIVGGGLYLLDEMGRRHR